MCADGAMIAVFVEEDEEEEEEKSASASASAHSTAGGGGGGFMPLRERAKEVGTSVLGALTSRPKKLIHVTMGRVLRRGCSRPFISFVRSSSPIRPT